LAIIANSGKSGADHQVVQGVGGLPIRAFGQV
jgi:hypothetical protein